MTNNITLVGTNFDSSTTVTVTIWTEKVEEDFQRDVTSFNKPVSGDTGAPEKKLIDLKRITHTFTIRGHVKDNVNGSTTAVTERTNLRGLCNSSKNVVLSYAGTNYSGKLQKVKITEDPVDQGSTPEIYEIMLTFIEGTDVVNR